jgi:hypothetical protein
VRLRSLIHVLEAAYSLVRPEQIIVLGSSSLLPVDPTLGETGHALEFSYDADLLVSPIEEESARILTEALGHESFFAKRHGYYADILRPEITETLPEGWKLRIEPISDVSNCYVLSPLDLALVKLILGRPKDLALVRELLKRGVFTPECCGSIINRQLCPRQMPRTRDKFTKAAFGVRPRCEDDAVGLFVRGAMLW